MSIFKRKPKPQHYGISGVVDALEGAAESIAKVIILGALTIIGLIITVIYLCFK